MTKARCADPHHKIMGLMFIVLVVYFFSVCAFATENKDGSVTLTPEQVKVVEARWAAAMQNINDLADVIRENADTIEKLKKQIEVGPNKTCL